MEPPKKTLKEIAIEQTDTIALLLTAIIAFVLATLEILQGRLINIVILLILCLLAFHHLRRSLNIEKMQEQINGISKTTKILMDDTKVCEEIGIEKIVSKRNEISIKEMHNEAKNADSVFILSRYFQSFANDDVHDALLKCLQNNGIVKIIIYSPKGSHLDVNIERDTTPQEAKTRIFRTIKGLRKFKEDLPPELKNRFLYKILDGCIIYTSIIKVSNKIYATNYLNKLRGDECPTIICKSMANNATEGLYYKFLKEFETLWAQGKSEDEMKASGYAVENSCSSFGISLNNKTK